jgi:hypothetical protein
LRRLRREVKVLAEERAILKSCGLLRGRGQAPLTVFAFVAAKKAEHSITIMCRLEVSRSGYHLGRAGRGRLAAG